MGLTDKVSILYVLTVNTHMAFESTEPCAYEWLVHLVGGAVEII